MKKEITMVVKNYIRVRLSGLDYPEESVKYITSSMLSSLPPDLRLEAKNIIEDVINLSIKIGRDLYNYIEQHNITDVNTINLLVDEYIKKAFLSSSLYSVNKQLKELFDAT